MYTKQEYFKKIITAVIQMTNLRKTLTMIGFVSALVLANPSFSQTGYVTDDFKVMLRTGPSVGNKIVKSLSSGTKLEVMRDDAGKGHSQVKTTEGEIGYILTRFISNTPSARNRVRRLESQISQLKSEPGSLRTLLANSQEQAKQLTLQTSNLSSQLNTTSTELENIKKISGESVNLAASNKKLESEVQQLLLQLDDIRIQNEVLKDQSAKRWFILGGSAILIGLLLGWILSIAKRSRRQSWGA